MSKFENFKKKNCIRIECPASADEPVVSPEEAVSDRIRSLKVTEQTTIEYEGKSITVSAKSLRKIKSIGEGNFGYVTLVEVEDHTYIRLAEKRLNLVPKDDDSGNYTANTDLEVLRTVGSGLNPHVIRYYGALVDRTYYPELLILMEVCETSMDKFYYQMHKHGILQHISIFVCRMISHMADALRFLKSKHILHRDVKPSNILLNQNPIIFKICDFGISAEMPDSVAKTMMKGTQIYLAPERIDKEILPCGYGIRSDMWSLGISALEIATKTHPFFGVSVATILAKMEKWTPVIPSNFSVELEQLIIWLLQFDHAKRPPNYEAILEAPAIQSLPTIITDEEIEMVKTVIEYISQESQN